MRASWLAPVVLCTMTACFPDYSVGEQLSPDMVRVPSNGQSFEFSIDDHESADLVPGSVNFDYDFEIDAYEVTVKDFRIWKDLGYPDPCGGAAECAMDGGPGPYDDDIRWYEMWNPYIKVDESQYTKGANCLGVAEGDYGSTTFLMPDNDDYPMTCVTWYLAAAYCGWAGKRLPTEAEWLYAASSHGENDFAWGDEPQVGCDVANVNDCGFPVGVYDGTKPTVDGVYGMGGSVFEWTWDGSWLFAEWPNDEDNYAGPDPDEDDPGHGRMRDGGAYWLPFGEPRLRNDKFEITRAASDAFDDAGFRCARTIR